MDQRRVLGNRGESLAAGFLNSQGYKVIDCQWRCRGGEIDLVCRDQNELVFVEVKTRQSSSFGYPEDSITEAKMTKLERAASQYLEEKGYLGDYRFDVVAITIENDKPDIVHMKNMTID